MIFEIVRTSLFYSKDKNIRPFEKSFPIEIMKIDERFVHDPEELLDKNTRVNWYKVGTNHRINKKGYIERDLGIVQRWGVEINSLEDLLKLKEEVKSNLIIGSSSENEYFPCIEIYDDYRE